MTNVNENSPLLYCFTYKAEATAVAQTGSRLKERGLFVDDERVKAAGIGASGGA
jgi:hypothetical protein